MATEKNITMKQYNGTDYDTLYPKTIVSQIEDRGDYYFDKSKTLTSDVASMFVNGGVTIPNDAFKYLGKYAEYWWKRVIDTTYTVYEETRANIETNAYMYQSGKQTSESFVPPEWSFEYSKTFSIDQSTGVVSLSNPSTFTVPSTGYSFASPTDNQRALINSLTSFLENVPCYCKFSGNNNIYYLPAKTTCGNSNRHTIRVDVNRIKDSDGNFSYGYVSAYLQAGSTVDYLAQLIGSKAVTYSGGNTYYSYSTNRNAYPDSGTVDGVTYEYLGIPFDNTVIASKIAVGSYIGTDAYGKDTPNSLTFDFVPKVLIVGCDSTASGWQRGCFPWVNGVTKGLIGFASLSSIYTVNITWNDTTVSWYGSAAASQLNASGQTYYYIALG